MYFFQQYPAIRIVLAFIAGIYAEEKWHWPPAYIGILFLAPLILYVIWFYFSDSHQYRFRFLPGGCLFIGVMLMGMLSLWYKDIRHQPHHISKLNNDAIAYQVVLKENPIRKKKSWRVLAEVCAVQANNKWSSCTGQMLLYFKPNDRIKLINARILLSIWKQAERIDSASFIPHSYRQFLLRQGVSHRIFINPNDYVIAGIKKAGFVQRHIRTMHEWTQNTLRKNIKDSSAFALAEALLIGYREDLDGEWKNCYTRAGIVHIIAISGMHLGLLYLALNWLLNRIPLLKKSETGKALICFCFLWIFSLLCGCTASVLRSAVMFSYLIIGKLYKREGQIYNALSVSALLLLMFDPYLLWDVGFQLSYLAIIGIVAFQQPLNDLWKIKSFIGRKIWEMAAVSIAAQITTFPLCVYYFHQFPNYFILSNIIAIPLSTLILFNEVFILIVSPLPHLAVMTGRITEWMIALFNRMMQNISNWPHAVTTDLFANEASTRVLYFLIGIMMIKTFPIKRASH